MEDSASSQVKEPPSRPYNAPQYSSVVDAASPQVNAARVFSVTRNIKPYIGIAASRKINPVTNRFRKTWFPGVTVSEWNSWQWQLNNRISSFEQLQRFIKLSSQEYIALISSTHPLPLAITPYYASLIDPINSEQPLRKTVVPVCYENDRNGGESVDPLHEENQSPVPDVVHRYPDRVLFLVTRYCSTYCRYCTRSRMVGHKQTRQLPRRERWAQAVAYIASHPEVRDVLLSGGDPLTLPDQDLEWLLKELRAIKHVEMIRIGTKVPMVLPQRITPALLKMLKNYPPLYMSVHCTHPSELTIESEEAFIRLADAGIPLGSQTVLLAGINDDVQTLKQLFHGLLRVRVRPYYLYQCDPILGSSHFRTPVETGIEIMRKLQGNTTGYAVPKFVIDAPGGGGKIPVGPDYIVSQTPDVTVLRNYEGKLYRYPDYQEGVL
jgi:lysine 2,3-aminomutase